MSGGRLRPSRELKSVAQRVPRIDMEAVLARYVRRAFEVRDQLAGALQQARPKREPEQVLALDPLAEAEPPSRAQTRHEGGHARPARRPVHRVLAKDHQVAEAAFAGPCVD